jgi:hypothetical protein
MKFEHVVIVIFIDVIRSVNSINYWKVTENGRIEANKNSFFTIQKPNDLVVFIKQNERLNRLNFIKDLLNTNIDENLHLNLQTYKSQFLNYDVDCSNAGFELQNIQFYDTYVSNLSVYDKDRILAK